MQQFIIFCLILIPISLLIAYFARGKGVREGVKYLLGIGKRKVARFLYEVRRKTFHLVGLLFLSFL